MVETRGRPTKNIQNAIKSYRKNPAKWLKDTYNTELWEKQEEIFNSVWNNRYTVVKSCFGSGKSHLAGLLADTFVHLYPNSIAITTAPSYRQLDNIWGVIHKVKEYTKAPLGSKLLKHEIQCGPQHFAMGFTTNMPERLQGIHASRILIIEDESAGIDSEIHKRLIDALMTGENCHFLAIGNPLIPEGHFFNMFTDPKFNKFTIAAFDTPNVIENKEIIPGLVTRQWVEDQRTEYGEDSPHWKSQVLGEFPPSGDEMLIPYAWARKAVERLETLTPSGENIYGLDPAGGGLDENILCNRSGRYVFPLEAWQVLPAPALAREVVKSTSSEGKVYVDEVGVGYGVKGNLQETNTYTEGVIAQASPINDTENRFYNLRAQLAWTLREYLDPTNENAIGLPDDDKLLAEITKLKYKISTKGKIQLESKEKMRSQGIPSPNRADALMLTMMPLVTGENMPLSIGVQEERQFSDNLRYNSPFDYIGWDSYYH